MKVTYQVTVLTFLITILCSCASYKRSVYLQDIKVGTDVNQPDSTQSTTENLIKIQPYDVLDIKIGSSKQGFDRLFESQSIDILSNSTSKTTAQTSIGTYFNGYFVDNEGNITLPLLGKVKISNLNIEEAKILLTEKSKQYLKDPYVDIKFLTFKVKMLGQVKIPGVVTIPNEKANIFEALSMSGDQNDFADIKNVILIRGEDKNQKIFKLDLTTTTIFSSVGYHLRPNDMIVIQPQKRKFFVTNLQSFVPFATFFNIALTIYSILRK